tara:strand:- start:2328 stop:2852 length:525 start_codon:yes stop_codon:yes gene_type:complete
MEMNTMKDENYWNEKTQTVDAWMEQNDAGAMANVLVAQNELLKANVANPTEADQIWAAIRAIAKMLPNTFIRPGRASALSPEIQAAVDSVAHRVETAYAEFYEANWDLLSAIVLPHGKTGGHYLTAQDAAEYMNGRTTRILKEAMKEGRWKGEASEGLPVNLDAPPMPEVAQEE